MVSESAATRTAERWRRWNRPGYSSVVTTATAGAPAVRMRAPLDPSVRALGFVSLLNDISSEVTVRTLPLFLANVLGVGAATIGLIEGVAESVSTLLRPVSGALSDRWGRKKPLTLAGYALSGFTKPLLYFASSWSWVLAVRVLDRV